MLLRKISAHEKFSRLEVLDKGVDGCGLVFDDRTMVRKALDHGFEVGDEGGGVPCPFVDDEMAFVILLHRTPAKNHVRLSLRFLHGEKEGLKKVWAALFTPLLQTLKTSWIAEQFLHHLHVVFPRERRQTQMFSVRNPVFNGELQLCVVDT